MSPWKRLAGRLRGEGKRAGSRAALEAMRRRDEERRRREEAAAAWRAGGPPSPGRITEEYETRYAALDEELRPWARPVAAWTLRAGEPSVTASYMGGRPALHPGEDWPCVDGEPLRFWAQVNLADLAPFAKAFGIPMPTTGLVQLFAGEEGWEEARYIPGGDLTALELSGEAPITHLWDRTAEVEEMFQRSALIELHPDVLIPWGETLDILYVDNDLERPRAATTSEDLPGYSFGWWPFSPFSLAELVKEWPAAPVPEHWTFLAVCNSNRDLGLAYSDGGFLWATLPAAELAAADFGHLRCDGESS